MHCTACRNKDSTLSHGTPPISTVGGVALASTNPIPVTTTGTPAAAIPGGTMEATDGRVCAGTHASQCRICGGATSAQTADAFNCTCVPEAVDSRPTMPARAADAFHPTQVASDPLLPAPAMPPAAVAGHATAVHGMPPTTMDVSRGSVPAHSAVPATVTFTSAGACMTASGGSSTTAAAVCELAAVSATPSAGGGAGDIGGQNEPAGQDRFAAAEPAGQ